MEHAFLSPSGAKLDIKCPGNRREQAKIPRTSNDHSAKGTGLHAVGAACLIRHHDTIKYLGFWCGETSEGADFVLKSKPSPVPGLRAFKVESADAANVQIYVSHVRERFEQLPGAAVKIEKRVKISEHCWGTPDAQILQPYGVLHVVDYKNGHTYVDATTPQLKLYAVGAMGVDNPYEVQQIICTIVQPNAIGEPAVRSIAYTPRELLGWYHGAYAPAAKKCLEPNAPLHAGPWCKDGWCDARGQCPALAEYANEAAQGMFSAVPEKRPEVLPHPQMLTPEQRRTILDKKDVVIDWFKAIEADEYSKAMHGENVWGKLVKGQVSRSWADESAAAERLMFLLQGGIYDNKLLSPSKAEAELKKRGFTVKEIHEKLSGTIDYKESKPKLVHVDAKGKAVQIVDNMFESI